MHIEKISDKQIRCTLNQKDLQDREIGISELAYGTAKAKALFRDLMQQASYEFGFDADDIPLMIEAIPLLPESLILVVTKVEDPDELDTRFSSFTEDVEWGTWEDDFDDEEEYDMYYPEEEEDSAEGVLTESVTDNQVSAWNQFNNPNFAELEEAVHANSDFISLPEALGMEPRPRQIPERAVQDIVIIFSFRNLDTVIHVAGMLAPIYHGENTLYKDEKEGNFYLLLHRSDHAPEEFNRICNLLHEYGTIVKNRQTTIYYFDEHYRKFISEDAVNKLAKL